MSRFGIPEPHKPRVDPSEFDDPFFTDNKKPNVYMELGEEKQKHFTPAELSPAEQLELLIDVHARLMKDFNLELTQQEASLVYQIDKDLSNDDLTLAADAIKFGRGLRKDMDKMPDEEIRKLPDYEQVKSLIIERLRSEQYVIQIATALGQVAEGLGLDPKEYSPNVYMATLIEKMRDWEERGIYDFLTKELITQGCRYNIVPVPNAEISGDKIISLAKKFGEDLPSEPVIDERMYELTNYSSSVLSGFDNRDNPIHLSLMPSDPNPELEDQTVEEQKETLQLLQTAKPNLNYQVPSLLTSVAFLFALRAHGFILAPDDPYNHSVDIFHKTDIRQFNLTRSFQGDLMVPSSGVDYDGLLSLEWYPAEDRDIGRLTVG